MGAQHETTTTLPDVRAALGPLALEALLFDDLEREAAAVRADPRRLARPLAILVPAHSLRVHLAAGAVRRLQRPLAGVVFDTLHGFAATILARAGVPLPRGASFFASCVRRHAREDGVLTGELAHVDEGWRSIVATLGDLFDGGFEAAHEPALLGALAARSGNVERGAEARAQALLRLAGAVARDLERDDLWRPTAVYRRAAQLLERDPGLCRTRAIWLHGFADATAAVLDLLAALQRAAGARLYFDATFARDGTAGGDREGRDRYGERFRNRLAVHAASLSRSPASAPMASAVGASEGGPRVRAFRAPGREAEVREVAARIARLLEPHDGTAAVEPERIGVVARELEPWRLAIRLHFGRLAIPFSAQFAGGTSGPAERRTRALVELLREGPRLSVERWFDAREPSLDAREPSLDARAHDEPPASLAVDGSVEPARARDFDLLLALRALGAVRLQQVVDLDLAAILRGREAYPLPVRRGSASSEDDHDASAPYDGARARGRAHARGGGMRRRSIPAQALARARGEVAELCARLAEGSARAGLSDHGAWLRALVRTDLRWPDGSASDAALESALASLESDLPPTTGLSADEFTSILEAALAAHGRTALDGRGDDRGEGRGGGVACLSVAEARARTFEHLFVLGLNQGVFPRPVRPDPLFPDELRRRIRPVLPDLALRGSGHAEERCLFEQLLWASADVTVSWQTIDDDGRALAPSTFVERFISGGADDVELAPPVLPRTIPRENDRMRTDPRPAHEHAILTALHRTRAEFVRILPAALREGLAQAGAPCAEVGALAAVRGKILDELDPPPAQRSQRARLGPYFGFLGRVARPEEARPGDPRAGDVFVTTLERMADCPWQTFLTRLLRIEIAPDPLDTLPHVDARMLGNLVHRVLQRIARPRPEPGPELELMRLRTREPQPLAWPTPREVDALAHALACEILRDEGIALAGLARVLVEQARPLFDVARRIDAEEAPETAGSLGTEVQGVLAWREPRFNSGADARADGSAERRLRFIADRVDARGGSQAGMRLTDYKTGAPISAGKRSETRAREFLQRVESGRNLQAVAYALAAGASSQGRYLFLKPELPEEARRFVVDGEDAALRSAFERSTAVLLGAWRDGAFFPRLVDAKLAREHKGCPSCVVSQACLRGDSGARARLVRWVRAGEGHGDTRDGQPVAAARRLWELAEKGGDEEDADAPEVAP